MPKPLQHSWRILKRGLFRNKSGFNNEQIKHLATVVHTFTLAVFAGLTIHSVLNDEWFRLTLITSGAFALELIAVGILATLKE